MENGGITSFSVAINSNLSNNDQQRTRIAMNLKTPAVGILAIVGAISCTSKHTELAQGPWLGRLVPDSTEKSMEVPFNMNVAKDSNRYVISILNANETIKVTEITVKGDSIDMKLPVFMSEIVARIYPDSLVGQYFPKGKENGNGYRFYALKGITDRFPDATEAPAVNVSGRWEITENPGTPDSTNMVGEFTQTGATVVGTWLNSGGDMRYLQGKVSGDKLMLSAVDGAHTLIMTAEVPSDNQMVNGKFLGSARWKSVWTAVRNNNADLPPVESLIHLKKGASNKFSFACVDLNGDTVRLSDSRFKNKVVIVSASGSWCPNCMDEVRFYSELYNKYKSQGLEIVALCFENKDLESSKKGIERFADQTGAKFAFLYAGPRGKATMDKVLYNLDGMIAFPTSIFIDRNGNIVKLHTGFSGPGTGEHYTKLVNETTAFVEKLLAEKAK